MKKVTILTVLVIFSMTLFPGEAKVEIKDVQPFWYASMEFSGSFNQMEQAIGKFMGEFFKQGHKPMGPILGIYYNDPTVVKEEELKWEVGFAVPADADVKAPLKKTQAGFKKAAIYLYTGPYEKMDKAYQMIFAYIAEQGYEMTWPTYDKYLNNPMEVKPEELKTEVIVPVKKK